MPELQGKYFSQDVASEGLPALVNEYRRTWAQILAGLFVLLGLYFTWRRVEISQRALETQQDQQVTERFTRAIDQLGATYEDGKPKLEIRLGGIYALERIARDSPKSDYSTVIEVLTAYVRQNAPADPSSLPPQESGGLELPPTDIQAVLDVLRRREEQWVPNERNVGIDLRRTNLVRANLADVNFEGANFEGANLARADLRVANLSGANLTFANLELAVCIAANLQGVAAEGVSLRRAFLRHSNLQRASFVNADLQGSDLQGATLLNVNFHDTDLMEADLRGANFKGVLFLEADLQGADLRGADLRGAHRLTQEQIKETIGDETTQLPEHLTKPASWTNQPNA